MIDGELQYTGSRLYNFEYSPYIFFKNIKEKITFLDTAIAKPIDYESVIERLKRLCSDGKAHNAIIAHDSELTAFNLLCKMQPYFNTNIAFDETATWIIFKRNSD